MTDSSPARGTGLGLIAILLWSTTVAFGRGLTERLGVFTAISTVFLLSGAATCAFWALRRRDLGVLVRFRPAYLLICGGLFAGYVLCLYGAIGAAATRQQVIEVGLLNYLWPTFTLLFALPLLGYAGRWTLWPGMVVAVAGTVVATAPTGGLTWSGWVSRVGGNPLPYGLAFVAAILWGLFSNGGRKWGPEKGIGALPLFVLVTGLLLTVLRLTAHEQPQWSLEAVGLVLWVSVFPISLAYAFWDIGVRTGNMVVLASLSYLIPALSTLISTLFLGVAPTAATWAGCALVIGGAVICGLSIKSAPRQRA
jgi:drug/metabolite transporter (DMT)-like permease